jgi:hypothetical protein
MGHGRRGGAIQYPRITNASAAKRLPRQPAPRSAADPSPHPAPPRTAVRPAPTSRAGAAARLSQPARTPPDWPYGPRRCRSCLPEEQSTVLTPHRAASAASVRIRPGCHRRRPDDMFAVTGQRVSRLSHSVDRAWNSCSYGQGKVALDIYWIQHVAAARPRCPGPGRGSADGVPGTGHLDRRPRPGARGQSRRRPDRPGRPRHRSDQGKPRSGNDSGRYLGGRAGRCPR